MKKYISFILVSLVLLTSTSSSFAYLSLDTQINYRTQIISAFTKFEKNISTLTQEKQLERLDKILAKIDSYKDKNLSDKNRFILDYVKTLVENKKSPKITSNENTITQQSCENDLYWCPEVKTRTDPKTGISYYNWYEYIKEWVVVTSWAKALWDQTSIKSLNDNVKWFIKFWSIQYNETYNAENYFSWFTSIDKENLAYHRYYASEWWTVWFKWINVSINKWSVVPMIIETYDNWNKLYIWSRDWQSWVMIVKWWTISNEDFWFLVDQTAISIVNWKLSKRWMDNLKMYVK